MKKIIFICLIFTLLKMNMMDSTAQGILSLEVNTRAFDANISGSYSWPFRDPSLPTNIVYTMSFSDSFLHKNSDSFSLTSYINVEESPPQMQHLRCGELVMTYHLDGQHAFLQYKYTPLNSQHPICSKIHIRLNVNDISLNKELISKKILTHQKIKKQKIELQADSHTKCVVELIDPEFLEYCNGLGEL